MHEKFAEMLFGGSSNSISEDRLTTWAKVASQRFINDGVPLNDSIQKIAQENDLNKNFVERLCEMSNMETHIATIPSEPEKRASFAFPLADSKAVCSSLSGASHPKTKIISDYAGPPKGLPGGGPSIAEMFGVKDVCPHNGGDIPERKRIIIMIQKKASERGRMHGDLLQSAMQCETAEKQFHKEAKQAVMHGMALEEMHKVACDAGFGSLTSELLPKTAQLLDRQFLITEEDMEKMAFEAPEELIDYSVPVRVINGRNPLLASLDTLKKYRDNTYQIRDGLMGLDEEVKVLRQRLKELE